MLACDKNLLFADRNSPIMPDMSRTETEKREEQRLAEMRSAVAGRLKRVCDGMDDEGFNALVLRIAQFKIKWGESLIYDNPPALGAWMFDKGDSPPSEE